MSGLLVSYVCIPNCRSGWRALAIRVELILLGELGQGQGWKGRDCCTSYFHGNTLASESVTSEAKMEIGWDWVASSASESSPDNLLVDWRGNQPCPSLPTHGWTCVCIGVNTDLYSHMRQFFLTTYGPGNLALKASGI